MELSSVLTCEQRTLDMCDRSQVGLWAQQNLQGEIVKAFYPAFSRDRNAQDVIHWLEQATVN